MNNKEMSELSQRDEVYAKETGGETEAAGSREP